MFRNSSVLSLPVLFTVGVITFLVRRSRSEMYVGHGRLSMCLSVPPRIPTPLHGPGCNLGEW